MHSMVGQQMPTSRSSWGSSSVSTKPNTTVVHSGPNRSQQPPLRRGCFERGGPHFAPYCPRKRAPPIRAAGLQTMVVTLWW